MCCGQPQLVLLSGISTSTSPWEKTKCWLNRIYSFSSKNMSRHWCSFFADSPLNIWAKACPRIDILRKKKLTKAEGWNLYKDVTGIKAAKDNYNHRPISGMAPVMNSVWACVRFGAYTAVMLRAALARKSSLNQRETRSTAHKGFRALINITHCNAEKREKDNSIERWKQKTVAQTYSHSPQ